MSFSKYSVIAMLVGFSAFNAEAARYSCAGQGVLLLANTKTHTMVISEDGEASQALTIAVRKTDGGVQLSALRGESEGSYFYSIADGRKYVLFHNKKITNLTCRVK